MSKQPLVMTRRPPLASRTRLRSASSGRLTSFERWLGFGWIMNGNLYHASAQRADRLELYGLIKQLGVEVSEDSLEAGCDGHRDDQAQKAADDAARCNREEHDERVQTNSAAEDIRDDDIVL